MNNHLQVAELYKIYKSESQPFRKVHRMIDLFESIIKSHTVLIIAEYVKHNKLSDAAKGLLAQGLRTPSLGTWQLFSRVLFEELEKDNYKWLLPDFALEFAALDKALNIEKTNVIALRNAYAHGATPTDAQCEADIKKFDSFLTQLIESKWLSTSSLAVRDNKVYLVCKAGEMTLHPMLLFRNEESEVSFAFFNDLKNDKIGLLNYPLSKHYREKDFFAEFHKHLPLNDWKETGNNEFYQRIEELTETFKGRTIEREKLLQFVLYNHKGYFSIKGNPGIGKSALIAQFFKDLRTHAEVKKLKVIEYFIRRSTQQAQVEYMFNYLIRRTDEVFPAGKEIRAEGKMVFDLQSQLFAKWRLWGEQANGQQLLFLIDGLDEGVENNVVTYLPRENFDNILIIYGSRPGGHKTIDDLWATLPVENHSKLELSGLGKEDIRALIYEVANKYEVERESAWIDAVQKRSQGNTLYLKLLCDAIENGSIELNDINALPEKIDEYYKAILQRYAQDTVDGDALLTGLFTFAAAKDYLTMAHLGLINKLGSATVQRIGSTLKEVLYENPLTEELLDYQLFHESFREYLVKEKAKEVSDAAGRIIDFCNTWQELEGSWEQRYPLEQYASHLFESKQGAHHETLIDLIYNKAFATEQMKTLKTFDASNRLYQLALLKASDLNKEDQMLEAALCLVDLKYEEANDAPQVVAMVANGEIELALKRIERFGDADEEGVKRKFILYMQCLMELTLLNSKEKPFRKSAIEKLLNHLDEQIPLDTSLIKWNRFFPCNLMFQMACEWAKIDLDYTIVYKRTYDWETNWIKEMGPFTDMQFDVLIECVRGISSSTTKSNALKDISTELVKQGQLEEAKSVIQEAIVCARSISYESHKNSALMEIAAKLAEQGQLEEALSCARDLPYSYLKSSTLTAISAELAKLDKLEEATFVMQEALASTRGISDESDKSCALMEISTELDKQGQLEEAKSVIQEALACAQDISDEWRKSKGINAISNELSKQGKLEEAASVMQQSIACARGIIYEPHKNSALLEIAAKFAQQGQFEQAIACAHDLPYGNWKISSLISISSELYKLEKLDETTSVMKEAITCTQNICDEKDKSSALKDISIELTQQGRLEEALEFAHSISYESHKDSAFQGIAFILIQQGQLEEALECAQVISSNFLKSNVLKHISTELAQQGQLEKALLFVNSISDDIDKSKALKDISSELAKKGQFIETASVMQKALACVHGININSQNSSALKDISTELAKKGQIKDAITCAQSIDDNYKSFALKDISIELAQQGLLKEAISCAREIPSTYWKSIALKDISIELTKNGQLEEAIACTRGINIIYLKSFALTAISAELAILDKIDEATSVMQEALAYTEDISDESNKSSALKDISIELTQQGRFEDAFKCACDIPVVYWRNYALATISTVLIKLGKVEEALESTRWINSDSHNHKDSALLEIAAKLAQQGQLEDALVCARDLLYDYWKSAALAAISAELVKQGMVKKAKSVIKEALSCARGIIYESHKNSALKNISNKMAIHGYWQLAEQIGLEITQIAERYSCWKQMVKSIKEQHGWKVTLDKAQKLQNEEARTFYLKGWAEYVGIQSISKEVFCEALPLLAQDTEALEQFLQTYAIQVLFFENPSQAKIQMLNQTLNLQWALDIQSQFPTSQNSSRLSTNLDNWLHEIEDEDDQDQITLWAKQVTKGKITEEEFQTRIKDI